MLNREYLRHSIDVGNATMKKPFISTNSGHGNATAGAVSRSINLEETLKQFVGMPNTTDTYAILQAQMERDMAMEFEKGLQETLVRHESEPARLHDNQLYHMFKQRFGREKLLHMFIEDMGMRSTDAAISRIVDLINATCQPILMSPEDYDLEKDIEQMQEAKHGNPEKQLQLLVDELNELMIVAKARLIYVDYPETATISIQITMTFDEEEDQRRLQQMEEILVNRKPKGLAEIEVSLTNKVVY